MVANALPRHTTQTTDIHALVQATGKPALGYAFYRLQEVLTGRWQQMPVRVLVRLFAVSKNTVTDYLDTLARAGLIRKMLRRRGSKTHLFLALPSQNLSAAVPKTGTVSGEPSQNLSAAVPKIGTVPSQKLGPLNDLSDIKLNELSDDPDSSPQGVILAKVGIASTHPEYQKMLGMDREYLQDWADYVQGRIQGNPAGYMIRCILKGDPVPGEGEQRKVGRGEAIDFAAWQNNPSGDDGSEADEELPPAAAVQAAVTFEDVRAVWIRDMPRHERVFRVIEGVIEGEDIRVTAPDERWRRFFEASPAWQVEAVARKVLPGAVIRVGVRS